MENNKEQSIEENLPMVNYIMLHRIYDMLTLIANKIVSGDEVNKMVEYHEAGYLLGPAPSYNAGIDEKE
jgi:hypothetical protein